jgi:hypothetical protein
VSTYADDYKWQLQFKGDVQRIVTETFAIGDQDILFTSPESEDDRRFNTDVYVMFEGQTRRMSLRLRRYIVGDEFTLRYFRPGSLTEWQKVWAGFGDLFFYGKGAGNGRVQDWFIGRMDVFKSWANGYIRRGVDPPHIVKANKDGSSHLIAFSRAALPAEFTVAEDEDAGLRDVQWSIVRDGKGMGKDGHGAAVRWARAGLGLDDD